MDKATSDRIQKLQMIEENLHTYLAQKQQAQAQLLEIESAASGLEGQERAFKIIGNVMVERPVDVLKKDLSSRLERAKLRVDAIEKQETRLKGQAELLQKEIMAGMGGTDGKL